MRVLLLLVFMFSLSCGAQPTPERVPPIANQTKGANSGTEVGKPEFHPALCIPTYFKVGAALEEQGIKRCDKQHGNEDPFKWAEWLIAIFTFGLVIATGYLWSETRNIAVGAKESSERQLRAYLGIKACQAVSTKDEVGFITHHIHLIAQNFGQTPAKRLEYWIATRDWPQRAANNFERKDIQIRQLGVINPGDNFTSKLSTNEFESTSSIWTGEHVAYVFGQFKYNDVFGKPWITDFRFTRSGNDWLKDGEWDICNDGNEAT